MRRPVLRLQAWLIGAVLSLYGVGINPVWCQEGPSFVIGDEFLRRLDTPTGIFWTDVPLREGLLTKSPSFWTEGVILAKS